LGRKPSKSHSREEFLSGNRMGISSFRPIWRDLMSAAPFLAGYLAGNSYWHYIEKFFMDYPQEPASSLQPVV
jgi:hypothetical protein